MATAVLPRAELHLHLDCAVSYSAVAALRPGTSLAAYRREYMAPATCPDLATFLERTLRSIELMQDRRGILHAPGAAPTAIGCQAEIGCRADFLA